MKNMKNITKDDEIEECSSQCLEMACSCRNCKKNQIDEKCNPICGILCQLAKEAKSQMEYEKNFNV
jgi:hypothetical protein